MDIAPGARALFAILEASATAELKMFIREAGGGDLMSGCRRIGERISAAMFGSSQVSLFERILQWQKKTGFDLGFTATPKKG